MIAVSKVCWPQLRYPQPHLAGLGLQLALVVAGPGIPTGFAALVALRIAQPIRLGIQQGVQRLLHAASHHPVEVVLDPLVVNRDDIAQRTRCSLGHGGSLLAVLVAFSHLQFSQIRGRQPYSIVRKILYVIMGVSRRTAYDRSLAVMVFREVSAPFAKEVPTKPREPSGLAEFQIRLACDTTASPPYPRTSSWLQ